MDDDPKTHPKLLLLSQLIVVCTERKKLFVLYGNVTKKLGEESGATSAVSFKTIRVKRRSGTPLKVKGEKRHFIQETEALLVFSPNFYKAEHKQPHYQ